MTISDVAVAVDGAALCVPLVPMKATSANAGALVGSTPPVSPSCERSRAWACRRCGWCDSPTQLTARERDSGRRLC